MIVVFDASSFIAAALKADSVPEQALVRAMTEPNRLVLSQQVEDEYREVLFRSKFDRFVSAERRRLVLDTVIFAADRMEPTEAVRECRGPEGRQVSCARCRGARGFYRQQRPAALGLDAPLARYCDPSAKRLSGAALTRSRVTAPRTGSETARKDRPVPPRGKR